MIIAVMHCRKTTSKVVNSDMNYIIHLTSFSSVYLLLTITIPEQIYNLVYLQAVSYFERMYEYLVEIKIHLFSTRCYLDTIVTRCSDRTFFPTVPTSHLYRFFNHTVFSSIANYYDKNIILQYRVFYYYIPRSI